MWNYLNKFRIYQDLAFKVTIGLLVSVGMIAVFQNCSTPKQTDVSLNPNVAPIGGSDKSPLIAPNTVKSKLIGGVEVPGFDTGTWIHAFVDDRCVLSREAIIKQAPFYFLDPYLAQQYPFNENVGRFNISLISFQLTSFLSLRDFERSLSLDACASGSYATSSSPTAFTYSGPNTRQGFENAWNQMGLDASILQSLQALNGSTKVNVGIAGLGFKTDLNPPLPLSQNAVGMPSGVPNSAGTVLASMIATPQSSISFRGVADGVAQLTPIVVPQNRTMSQLAFWLVKQAVNRGAEVFLLPFWTADENFCDPLIGQAFFYAIERGTTIVLPAGNGVGAGRPPAPGEIVGPRDFSLFQPSSTAQGSCWARYFRGVINVASSTNNQSMTEILSASNYGHEGVELIAPGQDVTGMGDDSRGVLMSGTEVSAALTAGAVAHIVSFYKKKGWFYSPWLVEDTLMNGSNQASNLPDTGRTVRRKKVLNFTSLKNFLTTLNSGSESDSRNQATDNPESGQSINLSSLAPGEQPIKLDVFSRMSNVFVRDRNQFQAVLYYASGALEVITDTAVWSSSDATNFPVDSSGVVRPTRPGTFTITARHPRISGLVGSYNAVAVDVDTVSGTNSRLVRLEIENYDSRYPSVEAYQNGYKLKALQLFLNAYAVYEDGRRRKVSDNVGFSVLHGTQTIGWSDSQSSHLITLDNFVGDLRGGEWHDLIIFYRGHKEIFRLFMPTYEWVGWRWVNGPADRTAIVKERLADSIDLYLVDRWNEFAFKYPMCRFLGGERDCRRNLSDTGRGSKCDFRVCGRLSTSTLPAQPAEGSYQLNQEYRFWGTGVESVKNTSINVRLTRPQMTQYFNDGPYFMRNDGPGPYTAGVLLAQGPIQLAPLCVRINARVHERNQSLGIDGFVNYRHYDDQSDITISTPAGYSGFIGDKASLSILLTVPSADPITANFSLRDSQISAQVAGPSRLLADPADPVFNLGEEYFGSLNLTTPRALPQLPAHPGINPNCSLPARANGSHSGTGTENDPFILCNWDDFSALANSTSGYLDRAYAALGKDIDLTGTSFLPVGLKNLKQLDGRNHRFRNAALIDREADVFLLSNIGTVKRIVFVSNRLTGRKVSLLKAIGELEDIFAFDNTLVGSQVVGVATYTGACRRVFTRNEIRYDNTAYSVCKSSTDIPTYESFSRDNVTFVGVVGSSPTYGGLSSAVIASGSASTIVAGGSIAGVARAFCYKCYSEVNITASNYSFVGGILHALDTYGSIEVGESRAQITAVGPQSGEGYVGGIAAFVGGVGKLSFLFENRHFALNKVGHTNLINSVFSGRVSGAGYLGGLFGLNVSQTDLYVTNTQMTGTVEGTGVKGSLIGKAQGSCVSSVTPGIKTRNVSKPSSLPVIGDRRGASVQNSTDY